MQFQLSHHWLSEFVDVLRSPAELAEQLSLHAASVERMHRMDDHLDRIVIGRVERIEPHPKADRLQVVRVAVGRTAHRVVCGGTNLRSGLRVAYAQPGAHVRWHGQGDLVELKPTDIRGVRSDGMICAASEIGLGEWFPEGEREILDLSHIVGSEAVGQSLAAALGLDDVIYEIEVPSNRPDLMSVMGLAREVAAITGARVRGRSRKSQVASGDRPHGARIPAGS